MEKTEWTITENYWDYQLENTLFNYDENERQEHLLNKMNAWVVLNPQFIPLNPRMLQNGYSFVESSIFWFLQFFLTNNEKFYCTNEQMAKMLNVNEKTISLAIQKLKDDWLIELTYKMKWWWWKIRFIHLAKLQWVMYDITKSNVATLPKHTNIENKYIENKNIIINNNTEQSSETLENTSLSINNSTLVDKEKEKNSAKKEKEITFKINMLISDIKNRCDELWVAYDKTKDRMFAKHILTAKEYWEFCDKIWQDRKDFALDVLIVSIKMNYWKWALSWPKKIYQNYADLYNWAKQKAPKIQTPIINVL